MSCQFLLQAPAEVALVRPSITKALMLLSYVQPLGSAAPLSDTWVTAEGTPRTVILERALVSLKFPRTVAERHPWLAANWIGSQHLITIPSPWIDSRDSNTYLDPQRFIWLKTLAIVDIKASFCVPLAIESSQYAPRRFAAERVLRRPRLARWRSRPTDPFRQPSPARWT